MSSPRTPKRRAPVKGPPKPIPPDQLMTVKQAAKTLACCKDTVYRKIKKGEIPVVRDGRSIRLRACDVRDRTRPE